MCGGGGALLSRTLAWVIHTIFMKKWGLSDSKYIRILGMLAGRILSLKIIKFKNIYHFYGTKEKLN